MRKTGRPKIEDDKRRDVIIQVRMNDEEAASLDELCTKFNCGRASFIRSLISKFHSDIYGGDVNGHSACTNAPGTLEHLEL